jgi:hypothetical protein
MTDMKGNLSSDHPLRHYFVEALHDTFRGEPTIESSEDIEAYLSELLVNFIDMENVFEIHDPYGRRIDSVTEMMMEADIRMNADSFAREREVHRHIGDFLLFWSGLFPEFLMQMKAPGSKDVLLDPVRQGQFSYHVVSTFEHGAYAHEAPIFKKLSDDFENYRYGLSLVRASFEGFARQGWTDGFQA